MAERIQNQKEGRENCVQVATSSDGYVSSRSDKFLIREKSDCIQKSGDTHSCRETGKQDEKKFKIRFWNAYKTATVQPYASSKSDCQGGPKAEKTE